MVIRSRIVRGDVKLTVCGPPTKEWLDWLLTAEVPLTADQIAWREGHREIVKRFSDLGINVDDADLPEPEESTSG